MTNTRAQNKVQTKITNAAELARRQGIVVPEDFPPNPFKGESLSDVLPHIFPAGKTDQDIDARTDFKTAPPLDPNTKLPDRRAFEFKPFVQRKTSLIPPRDWIYKPVYIRRFVTLTTARGGTGKSTLAMTEALAMATGKPLLGVKPLRPLVAVYWNGEDPEEELDRRFNAICKYYGITKADIGGRLFFQTGHELPIKMATMHAGGSYITIPVVNRLQNALDGADVATFDPFISTHSVSENDIVAIEQVAKTFAGIADSLNMSIGLVHHTRKATTGPVGQIEDSRGASSLIDAARIRRAINTMSEAQAKAAGIDPDTDRHRYISADLSRSNLSPPGDGLTYYKMESVDLGNFTVEQESNSVGVPTPYKYIAAKKVEFAPDEQAVALEAIATGGPWRDDVRSPVWVGKAIATALGLPISDAVTKARIVKLLGDLLAGGRIETFETKDEKRRPRIFIRVVPVADDFQDDKQG